MRQYYQRAEEFIALLGIFLIEGIIGFIALGLAFVVLAQASLLVSHVFFSFQERHMQVNLDWAYMLIIVKVALIVLFEMDRNEMLSRISLKRAGRLAWNSSLIVKVLFYVALPLAVLFATHFPELGDIVMRWFEPWRRMPVL